MDELRDDLLAPGLDPRPVTMEEYHAYAPERVELLGGYVFEPAETRLRVIETIPMPDPDDQDDVRWPFAARYARSASGQGRRGSPSNAPRRSVRSAELVGRRILEG